MKKLLLIITVILTSVSAVWAEDGTVVATMSELVSGAGHNTATMLKQDNSMYYCSSTYIGAINNSAVTSAYDGTGFVTIAMWIWGNSASGCVFGYGDQQTGVKFSISNTEVKITTKGIDDYQTVSLSGNINANQWNLIAFATPAINGTWGTNIRYYATATNGTFWTKTKTKGSMNSPTADGKKFAIGSGNQGNARETFTGIIANVTVIQSTALLNNDRIAALVGEAPGSLDVENTYEYYDGETYLFSYTHTDKAGYAPSGAVSDLPSHVSVASTTAPQICTLTPSTFKYYTSYNSLPFKTDGTYYNLALNRDPNLQIYATNGVTNRIETQNVAKTTDTQYYYMWSFEGDWYHGYSIKNRAADRYVSYGNTANPSDKTMATLVTEKQVGSYFDLTIQNSKNYFSIHGTTENAYISNNGGSGTTYLTNWNNVKNITQSDAGAQVIISEAYDMNYNTYKGSNKTIGETEWQTQSNWNLASGASWSVGPGYNGSNMWQPIYLKGVTATGIQLEGWEFCANLVNSSLTANTNKIQGNWTINVAEDSELILTMANSTSHTDDGTHTFNINGSMTINAKPNRFDGTKVSDNRVNIGENGHFELISSSNLSIDNSASFTINVTPTEPTNYNEVLSQEEPFAVIQNVTFAEGKLTFGTTNAKWERVYAYDNLSNQTAAGEHFYYFIEETVLATGEKKYKLYTYKQKIYSRNVTSGNFGSICLPNAVEKMDGIEKVLAVTKIGTDRVVMDEVEVDDMVAGVPYIFKSNESTINLTLKGNTVATPNNSTQTYLVGNFETPVFVPISNDQNSFYVLQSNQFKKVTSANSIKSGSNRCYLKVPVTSQSRMSTLGIAVDEGGATGIDALNALINNNAEIYDINGRKLKDLRKGINIVNGVKVLVK